MWSSELTLLRDACRRASAQALGTVPGMVLQWPFWARGVWQLAGGARWCRSTQSPCWDPQRNSFAFRNSALGWKVPRGRRRCSSVDGSIAPFPLLLNSGIFFPACNCLALTLSHWISLHELVWVVGVSRGNTGDHKSFLLIYKHQSLVI